MITGLNIQDSVKPGLVVRINTQNLIPDSVFLNFERRTDSVVAAPPVRKAARISDPESALPVTDTTAVCSRNIIADITFGDSLNFVSLLNPSFKNQLPYYIAENLGRQMKDEFVIIRDLKEGKGMPSGPFQNDWIVIVIFFSALLYTLIRSVTKNITAELSRFFLFKGINDPSSRDTTTLFRWPSVVLNTVSFFIIALFAWCAADYYGFVPAEMPGLLSWIIIFGIIEAVILSRHVVTFVTASISEQKDLFNEYLIIIYQSYNYLAFVLFIIIIVLVYTPVFIPGVLLTAGFASVAVIYLFRLARLPLIFIKRGISTFYLILYLCALEILPVLVLLKYFTGLS